MQDILNTINKTKNGYEVKDLRFLPVDNIIVGLVKCPILGRANLREGFICVQWTTKGKPLRINKGREDLILEELCTQEVRHNLL
jgi:hypothetical protein